jgi:hypothetical protein
MNKNFYRILLYSDEEDKGTKFFRGIEPCNLYKDEEKRKMMERYVKILTTFNVWVDAIVSR